LGARRWLAAADRVDVQHRDDVARRYNAVDLGGRARIRRGRGDHQARNRKVAAGFGLTGLGVMGLFLLSIRIENNSFQNNLHH
jgi:hypothetical protein